jgi:hypothetical protein
MEFEPFIPSLWPPTISVDGHKLRFVEKRPLDLVWIIATDQWPQIVPYGLEEESKEHVLQRLSSDTDQLGLVGLIRLVHKVVERTSGTSWHATQVICSMVASQWLEFDAWSVEKSFDTATAPLHRIVAAGYGMIRESYIAEAQNKKRKPEIELIKLQNILWPPDEKKTVNEEHKIMQSVIGTAVVQPDGTLA